MTTGELVLFFAVMGVATFFDTSSAICSLKGAQRFSIITALWARIAGDDIGCAGWL